MVTGKTVWVVGIHAGYDDVEDFQLFTTEPLAKEHELTLKEKYAKQIREYLWHVYRFKKEVKGV